MAWYNNAMGNWFLTAILLNGLVQTVILLVVFSKFFMIFREFVSFITPAEENTPSAAGLLWKNMVKSLVTEIKMVFMGLASVQSKAEKRAEAEAVEAGIAVKSPAMAAALGAFPQLRKLFLRNPGLVDYAISKLATTGNKNNGTTPPADDYGSRLSKYS